MRRSCPWSFSPLNRGADEGAPLCPRTVVVAHARVREQLVKNEPGMRAALSDAAVSNDLAVWRDALALVKRLQLLSGEECPGRRVDSLRPGDVLGARDMTRLLRLLLGQVRRGRQYARAVL